MLCCESRQFLISFSDLATHFICILQKCIHSNDVVGPLGHQIALLIFLWIMVIRLTLQKLWLVLN